MLSEPVNFTKLLGVEEPTDMGIALYILRLMDDGSHGFQSCKDNGCGRDLILRLAEEALKTMTNPCSRKLLMDKTNESIKNRA